MFFNTLTPFGTVGATSGVHDLVGILTFGASTHLGGIYGGNKFLVSEPSSSRWSGVGGVIDFPFLFLFPKRFPHLVPNGHGMSVCSFPEGLTRIGSTTRVFCLVTGGTCTYGGIYQIVYPMY